MKYHYLFPYAACIVLSILLFRGCERMPDNKKEREALEKSEKFWRDKADSLSKNIQVRIDTLVITKVKLKTKNDTIFITQGQVGNLNADSSYSFFCKFTGATVIHD